MEPELLAARAFRVGSSMLALAALVAFNIVPLIGVLAWDWSMMLVLVLYWLENGVIGVMNVFKIATAAGPIELGARGASQALQLRIGSGVTKAFIIPFFCLHYGGFWVGHGIFLFLLPLFAGIGTGFGDGLVGGDRSARFGSFGDLDPGAVTAGIAALSASHVTSFFTNWIGRGEYRTVSPTAQMGSVYGRVVILHVTILGSAFLIGLLGTPLAALVLLIVLKTILDVVLHLREHRRAADT